MVSQGHMHFEKWGSDSLSSQKQLLIIESSKYKKLYNVYQSDMYYGLHWVMNEGEKNGKHLWN